MSNRHKFTSVLRTTPLFVLFLFIFYLGFINWTSEVYIDLISDTFRFNVAKLSDSEELVKFNIGVPIKALQLFNCSLDIYFSELNIKNETSQTQKDGMTKVSTSGDVVSQVRIEKEHNFYPRSLNVPTGAKISITKESNLVTLAISQPADASGRSSDTFGVIGVGNGFMLTGKNIQLSGLRTNYRDYGKVQITTQKGFSGIGFVSENKEIVLQLTLPESQSNKFSTLLENFQAENIAFTLIERAKFSDRVRSDIKSGIIQIAGINIFKKRFMIKEQMVNESEFVDISNKDVYLIDFVKLNNNGLIISLFSDSAHDIKTGRRSPLVHSIFPSILDVIISEPSKNTVWAIFIFLVTQAAIFSNFFRRKK